jgi:uncharacterized protein YbbC (DUF1343 family)
MAISIIIMPIAIAAMAIFIIGADMLLLGSDLPLAPDVIIRFAMKNSKLTPWTYIFFKNTALLVLLLCFSCRSQTQEAQNGIDEVPSAQHISQKPVVGANQMEVYLPLLKGKKIALVANQTSVVFKDYEKNTYVHLADTLLSRGVSVTKVFAPEHGFRGTADAGEIVKDGKDTKTGLPIVSLYGNNKKPTQEQLQGLDMVLFDIQDVGARFYTYISTLHYVMEACAEAGIPLLILDRPNPNIHYIDGPVLEPEFKSFVGMHPIPVVHGMTIAEYAKMINGEGWLSNQVKCKLEIVEVANYNRQTTYSLPIKPSPNLPNDQSINLYPSICFFEGTPLSEGRGTAMQFQVFGSPELPQQHFPFSFTPMPNEGAKSPKFNGQVCYGKDLREAPRQEQLNLSWLIGAYAHYPKKESFFTNFFTTLAGTKKLQQAIEKGVSETEIRASWQKGLEAYDSMRRNYMIYP